MIFCFRFARKIKMLTLHFCRILLNFQKHCNNIYIISLRGKLLRLMILLLIAVAFLIIICITLLKRSRERESPYLKFCLLLKRLSSCIGVNGLLCALHVSRPFHKRFRKSSLHALYSPDSWHPLWSSCAHRLEYPVSTPIIMVSSALVSPRMCTIISLQGFYIRLSLPFRLIS